MLKHTFKHVLIRYIPYRICHVFVHNTHDAYVYQYPTGRTSFINIKKRDRCPLHAATHGNFRFKRDLKLMNYESLRRSNDFKITLYGAARRKNSKKVDDDRRGFFHLFFIQITM
jgi:hypothetical protein